MLIVKNISKILSGKEIVRDVSFDVNPGKALAIVGPNGAGKSVLMRAVSLTDPPTSGEIGIDTHSFAFPALNNGTFTPPWPQMTVVFQQLFLWPHMTLRENALLPLKSPSAPRDGVERLEYFIDLFNLRDVVDRRPNRTSLGQRQMAALIRALVLKPKWLILDETTSALDVEQTQRVLCLLKELKQEAATGIIFITHLLGFAAALADEVLFLDGGQLVERGEVEILTDPKTDRMKAFVRLIESVESPSKTNFHLLRASKIL